MTNDIENRAELDNIDTEKYGKKYSEEGLWDKVTSKVKAAGIGLIYKSLQLYYVAQNPACPAKVKAGIYAALGYFIVPFDLIPDIAPGIGYADDVTAVGAALVMAQMYIDDAVKENSRNKICELFGEEMLTELDAM